MKKYLVLVLICCGVSYIKAERQVFAHSFMYTKPGYYDVIMEQALWHDIAYNKRGSVNGGLQITPFIQRSMSLPKTARYFLMKDKNDLLVSGDANTADFDTRDIRAEWIGLPSNFRGTLSMNPKQQQDGCLFEYHQDLKRWTTTRFLRDMYISISIPVSVTHNNIHFTQSGVMNPQTTFPQNILQAFDQPSWNFSRIESCGDKRVGVAELRLKLGTSYISENSFQLNYYSVFAIPTGNKQNGEKMFQAVNGNNRHLGIGAGISLQAPMNRDLERYAFCFFVDLESVILIRNKQFRTYDLYGKPWTRFILVNKPNITPPMNIPATTDLPGVNFMTQRITAKPFNVVDFAFGWRLKASVIEAELGYGIWGHGNERTDLNQPFTHVFGIAGSAPGKTASKSTIAFQAPDDAVFVPITKADLDPQSGESEGGFNNRFLFSLGWVNEQVKTSTVLGAGCSVDVPFHNSLLQLWKFWIKLSATF
jgi:hypothetical protein